MITAKNVMEDHGRLGTFLEGLNTPLLDMGPIASIGQSNLTYRARGKTSSEYAVYFYGGFSNDASLTLSLGAGQYTVHWYSPSTGNDSQNSKVLSGTVVTSPWSNEYDAVLHLMSGIRWRYAPSSITHRFTRPMIYRVSIYANYANRRGQL